MPQETMLFDGALAHSETHIHLEQTAVLLDGICWYWGGRLGLRILFREVITTSLSYGARTNY
jgi:hypothetical protein